MKGKRLIVSPLDWGLGHASRMIPVIKHLSANNKVYIVCGKKNEYFFKSELPDIEVFTIYNLEINYFKKGVSFFNLLLLIFKVAFNSFYEHFAVKKIIKKYNINAVFSDNRYGLLFKGVECYFFTHQIFIILPKKIGFLENFVHICFTKYLSKFDKCFIPDFETGFGVSGILSDKKPLNPLKFKRIGILSRFNGLELKKLNVEFDFLVLLSGCENQRTILENILIEKFSKSNKKVHLVRGGKNLKPLNCSKNIKVTDVLTGDDLLTALSTCKTVVCRSGYSTVCDLIALKKSGILVATPGQTEQEYLAERLDGKFNFLTVNQDEIKFSNLFE